MQVRDMSALVGSEITLARQDFLSGRYAPQIQELLVARSALVFPNLHLTDEEQLQFASTIGQVHRVGGDLELQNISMDPKVNRSAAYTRGAFYWHIDGANDRTPAKATMLSVRTLPAPGEGGDTLVANTYAAYRELPAEEKAALEGVMVRHTLEASQRLIRPQPTVAELERWRAYPSQTHPLVWHHRHGETSLLLGASCFYVEGMDLEAGSLLLCRLLEWATQPRFVYRHQWRAGDFLLFDNTGTLHRAGEYPMGSQRLMRRTTLVGEEPIH